MHDQKTRSISDRRTAVRHDVRLDVNYRHGETYLFSRASNLSELGIFVVSDTPLPKGTNLELQFSPTGGGDPLLVQGEVMWVNDGKTGCEPGMGIRFVELSLDMQKRIKSLIRTVAYLE